MRGSRGVRLLSTMVALMVAALELVAQGATSAGVGTISGLVREPSGLAISNAEIVVEGQGTRARTDASGTYRLLAVPAGTVTLTARRLGFRAVTRTVELPAGGLATVAWELEAIPAKLAEVKVTERRQPFDSRLAGFKTRMENKRSGHFIDRKRIESSANTNFLDLLRGLPGVKIGSTVRGSAGRQVRFRNANCAPLVFIDGVPATAADFDLESIDVSSVEGAEVYLSSTTLPPEFFAARGLERCGVVAIWSRPFRPRPSVRAVNAANPTANTEALVSAQQVYMEGQVDQAATPVPGSFQPAYPDSLLRARVTGAVRAEFVVDTLGKVEWGTYSIVSSSRSEFAVAVREALELSNWVPAMRRGRKVRQLVLLPVGFDPAGGETRPQATGSAKPNKD